MRWAAKLDANHNEVREHLEKNGYTCFSTAQLGHDFPDLIVARDKFTGLVEVKDGSKPPSRRKVSHGQESFRKTWPGIVITALSGPHALMQLEAWRILVCKP